MSQFEVIQIGNPFICPAHLLSEETRRKLLMLGIDPSGVTSEAQAKVLIHNAEQKKFHTVQEASNESNSKNTFTRSEAELVSRAKIIAKKLGVSLPSNVEPPVILQSLSDKIIGLLAEDNGNTELAQYREEVQTLQDEYAVISKNQTALFTMLDQSANMNRYILGLG